MELVYRIQKLTHSTAEDAHLNLNNRQQRFGNFQTGHTDIDMLSGWSTFLTLSRINTWFNYHKTLMQLGEYFPQYISTKGMASFKYYLGTVLQWGLGTKQFDFLFLISELKVISKMVWWVSNGLWQEWNCNCSRSVKTVGRQSAFYFSPHPKK